MGIKQFIKRLPIVGFLGQAAANGCHSLKNVPDLYRLRSLPRQEPIRVGFLCQYIPAWRKVSPIYHQMLEDPRFDPVLLCVPSGIKGSELIDPTSTENDTYLYFLNQGYSESINTLLGPNQWLDLETLGLAYIFYPRPYNAFMPKCYRSHQVRRYCRILMIMYGITLDETLCRTTLNPDFMGSVSCYFAETAFSQKINRQNHWLTHMLGLQRSVCLGSPVLESLFQFQDQPSSSWDFSRNEFRAIWTPRWTTDKSVGGSNFFTYWKALPDYAQRNPDMDFLFRPHPLTFSHFVETGEMTQEQVEQFQARCEALPNVQMDPNSDYMATLWGSSVLISDYSSLMVEYFLTGKPMIFCASNMELTLAEFSQKMLFEGSYVVYDQQELFACLENLKNGIDPLAEKRRKLIKALFGDDQNASARILEFLAEDQRKK